MEPKVDSKANAVGVLLDEGMFPRPVGLAAAYRFLDRCYVQLERRPQNRLLVRLKGKEPLAEDALRGLGEEFGNEVVHQMVRHQLSERTEQLRATLLERALASAMPTAGSPGPEVPPGTPNPLDYLDDPLGIAVPWEEKHAEKPKAGKSR